MEYSVKIKRINHIFLHLDLYSLCAEQKGIIPTSQYSRKILFPLFVLLLLVGTFPLSGQYFEGGQDPANLKWQQINTPHFQIVFPDSFNSEAERLANIMEYAWQLVPKALAHQPRKISIIVHNYSVESNGFVAWAPKRMELYPVPAPDSWPQDELEQLALHETRHVVQIDKINQGITKVLSYLIGEQAPGAFSVLLPLWLLEGDAVASETALSHTGRGRLPSFEMELRAISLERGKVFKFDKSLFGSYKDHVPGYYEYGYKMVAYAREKYGPEIWQKAIDKVGKSPFLVNPVNVSLRENDNLNKKKLYDRTFDKLHQEWLEQDKKTIKTTFYTLSIRSNNTYTSYRFPQYVNDSLILVEKSGIDQLNKFVTIDRKGNENVIHTPGFYYPARLSYASGLLVWAESYNDARWSNRSYSILKKLNLKTGAETTLTKKSRYFAPALSPDGGRIVTIDINVADACKLTILNSKTGQVFQSFQIPGNNSLHMPEWVDKNQLLVIVIDESGKSIRKVDTRNGKWSTLFSGGFDDIQKAVPYGKYVFFQATYSGIDNYYALDTLNRKIFRITSSRFGVFDVAISPGEDRMALADYSSDGYNLVELPVNEKNWIPLDAVQDFSVKEYEQLQKDEKEIFETEQIPKEKYPVQPYRKWMRLFNFHSWMPFYFDYSNFTLQEMPVSAGVTLLSQNKLSTAVTSLGYYYKNKENHLATHFTYKGWVPVLDLSWDYGGEPIIHRDSVQIGLPASHGYGSDFNAQVYVPLNFTQNRFIRGIYPSLTGQYTNSYIYNGESGNYDIGRWFLNYRFYAYNYLKLSTRDIKPRQGQILDINFTHAPFNANNYGTIGSVWAGLYFPGFSRHHSIYIRGGFEKQNPVKFLYYNRLSIPRGYTGKVVERLKVIKGDYYLPLLYPEINIGSILYVPRLYGSLFFDYAKGKGNYDLYTHTQNQDAENYASFGGKLNVDFHLLRFPFPLNFGLQYAYIPSLQTGSVDFGFSIDFYGFTVNKE